MMKMMNFAHLSLEKDQNVAVTARHGTFIGLFNKLSFNGSRLDLLDVKDENGKSRGNFKYFFQRDVISVEVVPKINVTSEPATAPVETTVVQQSPSSSGYDSTCRSLISLKQKDQIESIINNRIYIQQADAKYAEAVADISKQFVIGISAEGCMSGRLNVLNLLTISTVNNIYIFDIPALNPKKTMRELKEILQCDNQLKVVYDCFGIQDNLQTKFGVALAPVIDLMLVAAQSHPKKKVVTLSGCIDVVLGFSIVFSDKEQFFKRPISQEDLDAIAAKTAFHLAMYHKLVQHDFASRFQPNSEVTASGFKSILFGGLETNQKLKNLESQSIIHDVKPIDYSIYTSD